jgi:hypothetical protein
MVKFTKVFSQQELALLSYALKNVDASAIIDLQEEDDGMDSGGYSSLYNTTEDNIQELLASISQKLNISF